MLETTFSNESCNSKPIGITEYNSKYKIYPNPVKGELTIEISDIRYPISDIVIYDVYGRECHVSPVTRHENKIDVSHLPAGIYFIKIENEFVGKFFKE
jgi:hypothetical protein